MSDNKEIVSNLPESDKSLCEAIESAGAIKPHRKGITGSTLKIIAMVSMLLDHLGLFLLFRILAQRGIFEVIDQQSYDAFMDSNAQLYIAYEILRLIGRIALPIFCFLLVQGFLNTHNLKKYLGRLLLFALVSEIPFNLALSGNLFELDYQNIYFTLFLGILALAGIRRAEENKEWHMIGRVLFGVMVTFLCVGAAAVLRTDYDMIGVCVIVVFYLLRKKRMLSMGLGCALLLRLTAFISLLPIYFYNGQRGSNIKWIFYLFYPVHILLIYLLACALGMGQISLV